MNLLMAKRFAQLRKQAGLSQEELAEKLGISRQAVSKWERAESSPDTDNLIALSRIYGISLDELVRTDSVDTETEIPAEQPEEAHPFEEPAPQAPEPPHMEEEPAWPFEASRETSRKKEIWEQMHRNFDAAFPILIAVIYGFLGAIFQIWHPGWILFLLIPIYYVGLYGGYPILMVFCYLLAGFGFGWWHPAWVLFLTIPLFYLLYHPRNNEKDEEEDEPEQGENAPEQSVQ